MNKLSNHSIMRCLLALMISLCVSAAGPASLSDIVRGPSDKADAKAQAQQYLNMQDAEKRQLWAQFKQQFNKNYGSDVDSMRYQNFIDAMDKITAINMDDSRTFVAGLNAHADKTAEEWNAMVMHDMPPMPGSASASPKNRKLLGDELNAHEFNAPEELEVTKRKLLAYPNSIDHQAGGLVTSVKNQGGCGSCWAFSGVAAVESLAILNGWATNTTIDLSEQHITSCIQSGCNGGWPDDVFSWISSKNVTVDSYWPYTATTGTCDPAKLTGAKQNQVIKLLDSTSYSRASAYQPSQFFDRLAIQPIAIGLYASTAGFQYYKSGVFDGADCGTNQINHALLATGYDISAGLTNAASYIRIKNSWGSSWGDAGYVKMSTNPGTNSYGPCSMYYYGSRPLSSAFPAASSNDAVYNTYTTTPTWFKYSDSVVKKFQCAQLCVDRPYCAQWTWTETATFNGGTSNCYMVDRTATASATVYASSGAYGSGKLATRMSSTVPIVPDGTSPSPPPTNCQATGTSCTSNGQCCNGKCTGKTGSKKCN